VRPVLYDQSAFQDSRRQPQQLTARELRLDVRRAAERDSKTRERAVTSTVDSEKLEPARGAGTNPGALEPSWPAHPRLV